LTCCTFLSKKTPSRFFILG